LKVLGGEFRNFKLKHSVDVSAPKAVVQYTQQWEIGAKGRREIGSITIGHICQFHPSIKANVLQKSLKRQ